MRFARTAAIFNAIRDDHADRDQSMGTPWDRWPSWTDNSFGLAPAAESDDRPQLAADPTPRLAGKAVPR